MKKKILKKSLAMFLTLTMVLSLVPAMTISASAASTAPASGDGTANNPFLISSEENLNWMAENYATVCDKYFVQTSDITMKSTDFTPIGNSTTGFSGTYDGDWHTISDLKIVSVSDTNYIGLFRNIANGGTVRNLKLSSVNISLSTRVEYVGAIAARNGGTIENCCVISGSVAGGPNSQVGGLAGYNGGTITACYNSASVSVGLFDARQTAAGGIAGCNYGNVNNCRNSGSVRGGTSSTVASMLLGGIAGLINSSNAIVNCYSTGTISCSSDGSIGGIVGGAFSGNCSGNYYLDTCPNGIGMLNNGSAGDDGTTRISEATFKIEDTFSAWVSAGIWSIPGGVYPTLLTNVCTPTASTATAGEASATVSWSPAMRAGGYYVYWSTMSGSYNDTDRKLVYGKAATSATITGLENFTTYYFVVKAIGDGDSLSSDSNELTATPIISIKNLVCAPGNGRADFTFTIPSGATSVILYQSMDGGTNYTIATTADTLTNTSTSAKVSGLTNGEEYKFKLVATVSGHEVVSSIVSCTPVNAVTGPTDKDAVSDDIPTITKARTAIMTGYDPGYRYYKFLAPETGSYTIFNEIATQDAKIYITTEKPYLAAGALAVGENDDVDPDHQKYNFSYGGNFTGGTTYYFAIGNWSLFEAIDLCIAGPGLPNATISTTPELTEGNLSTGSLTVTITNTTFAAALDKTGFTLNNAPTGVSVSSVTRVSDTTCTVGLSCIGTDFDANKSMSLTIPASQVACASDLRTNAVTVTAVVEAAPTVSSVSPETGSAAGGTSVTITGTNLTGATSVTIGGTAATGISVVNATTITATVPAGEAGAKDIVVTTPGGTATGTGLFTYIAAPTVTSISPSSGPLTAGTSVTITGTNFTGATEVTIGGAPATGITVVNSTTITATAPAGTEGAKDIFVTTPGGTATGTGLFTYVAPNTAPSFVGASTTLTINQNVAATDIKSLLHVSDTDSGQTLTWTEIVSPIHGILAISSATAASGGPDIAPGGTLTYTPTAGFAGTDSFTIQVSDGKVTATRTINVTVQSSDAGLTSVAEQTITAGLQVGTMGVPKTASINVTNAKATIGLDDIVVAVNATKKLYSDPSFSTEITGGTTIELIQGQAMTAYIKITAQDTTTVKYYAVTINRAAGLPAVTTNAASSITYSAATVGGTVTATGGAAISEAGVVYSTNSGADPEINGAGVTKVPGTGTSGAYTASLSSLSPNTTYNVRAYASNSVGTSYGAKTSFTTLTTVPGAPTSVSATAGDKQATVTFTAPAANGGVAITGYTVTSNPAGGTDTNSGTTGLTHVITGLSNGTEYTFTVTATNSAGPGSASTVSNIVTPKAAQIITFSNPGAQNFGTTPTLTASSNSGLTPTFTSSNTEVATITTGGVLTFHSAGTATITANQAGDSSFLAATPVSQTFTVNAVAPGAPTSVSPTAGDKQATVTFAAPVFTGGAAITGYTVISSPGGITATSTGSPITVTGLTNGSAYTFMVTATNAAGTSLASLASISVTPFTNSTITPASANFDKYASATNYKDIDVTLTLNSNTLTSIKNGANTLVLNTDYTVSGATCTIKKEYLRTISTGAANITFDFSRGVDPVLALAVSNSTPTNSGSSSGASSTPTQTSTVVEINGQKQDVGTSSTATSGGQSVTTIKVDDTKMDKLLENSGTKPTVALPSSSSDVVVGQMNGQTVKSMESKEAVLEIKTGTASYTLPASQINIDKISEQLGSQVALKDIEVSVSISKPSADTVKIVEDTANKNNYQLVVKPVEFEITCTSGGKKVDVSKFNGYVERTVAIPAGVDPSKITTGIVLNADGTFRHVPTTIIKIDGKYYAKINSLTNSTYSVIYSPVTFADVANHWAKIAINDMGSRMVVTGVGSSTYEPDRSINRAEFAAIVVRALGLQQGKTESSFGDVSLSDWFNGFVDTATGYGLITGYSDAAYGPNDTITREQAMAIIARAMKTTGLSVSLTDSEVNSLLANYTDGASVSSYAKASAATCLKSGVVMGTSASTLSPKAYVTRAEVAVMVQHLLQKSGLI